MFACGCEFIGSWKTTGHTSNQTTFSRVNEAKLELGLTLWTLHDQPSFRINLGIFLLGLAHTNQSPQHLHGTRFPTICKHLLFCRCRMRAKHVVMDG